MNSAGKLQVDEWADDPRAMRVHKRIRWLGISPAFFGALGTLFLHALIFQWLPLGGFRTHKNVELPLPTVNAAPASKPDISLVIVNLISASASAPIAVSVMTRSELASNLDLFSAVVLLAFTMNPIKGLSPEGPDTRYQAVQRREDNNGSRSRYPS